MVLFQDHTDPDHFKPYHIKVLHSISRTWHTNCSTLD